jgi:hypothetical protein
MSRLEHFEDFIFGVLLLAVTPILVFIATSFLASKMSLFEGYSFGDYVGRWAVLGVSFTGFLLACIWRKKHRRIPNSMFPFEVVTSIIFGVGFMIVLLTTLYAAGGAD